MCCCLVQLGKRKWIIDHGSIDGCVREWIDGLIWNLSHAVSLKWIASRLMLHLLTHLHCTAFFFCFVFHLERSHCFREGNILCIRRKSRWKKNTCRLQSVRNSASSKKKKKKTFLCQTAALVTVIMPFGETVFASASTFISPLGVDSGDKSRWTRGFLLLYLYIRWCFCQCGVYLRAPEGS